MPKWTNESQRSQASDLVVLARYVNVKGDVRTVAS